MLNPISMLMKPIFWLPKDMFKPPLIIPWGFFFHSHNGFILSVLAGQRSIFWNVVVSLTYGKTTARCNNFSRLSRCRHCQEETIANGTDQSAASAGQTPEFKKSPAGRGRETESKGRWGGPERLGWREALARRWPPGLDGESEKGRKTQRDRFVRYLDPSPFTEGLYEAQSLPVSTLRLQIPPRFVDRMAVSYSCKEKLHSAAMAFSHAQAHALTHTNTQAWGDTSHTCILCANTLIFQRENPEKWAAHFGMSTGSIFSPKIST